MGRCRRRAGDHRNGPHRRADPQRRPHGVRTGRAFTRGTNHFTNAGAPDDTARVAEYEAGPYRGFAEQVQQAFAAIVPDDADPASVSDAIAKVVDTPFGQRPFRVHVDPTQDGADVGFTVLDRMRTDMLYRVGLGDLTKPRVLK
jgi:hypothetical protein